MAYKLFAYFTFFLLFSVIPRPDIHEVEARFLLRKPNELSRLSLQEMEPTKSGPSPGAGHAFDPKEDGKRTAVLPNANSVPSPGAGHVIVNAYSVPSLGAGHEIDRREDGKRTFAVNANSGPSPGVGHSFDRKDYGKGNTSMKPGPSPGVGHRFGGKDYGKGSTSMKTGPSPGEGHKHVAVGPIDENKS